MTLAERIRLCVIGPHNKMCFFIIDLADKKTLKGIVFVMRVILEATKKGLFCS